MQDPGLSSGQTEAESTQNGPSLAVYLEEHADMHGDKRQRWRQFVQWSALFNSTEAASHPHLLNWFQHHDDVLLDQPTCCLNETNTSLGWVPKKSGRWFEVHERHAQEVAQHKVSNKTMLAAVGLWPIDKQCQHVCPSAHAEGPLW